MPSRCSEGDDFNVHVHRNSEIALIHDAVEPREPNYVSETGREDRRKRIDAMINTPLQRNFIHKFHCFLEQEAGYFSIY
jgi:hypothetical protein